MHARIRGSRDRGRATGWAASAPSTTTWACLLRYVSLQAQKTNGTLSLSFFKSKRAVQGAHGSCAGACTRTCIRVERVFGSHKVAAVLFVPYESCTLPEYCSRAAKPPYPRGTYFCTMWGGTVAVTPSHTTNPPYYPYYGKNSLGWELRRNLYLSFYLFFIGFSWDRSGTSRQHPR